VELVKLAKLVETGERWLLEMIYPVMFPHFLVPHLLFPAAYGLGVFGVLVFVFFFALRGPRLGGLGVENLDRNCTQVNNVRKKCDISMEFGLAVLSYGRSV
jgi:hypothetical protein